MLAGTRTYVTLSVVLLDPSGIQRVQTFEKLGIPYYYYRHSSDAIDVWTQFQLRQLRAKLAVPILPLA